MSSLWTRAMPWIQHPEDPPHTPVPVKHGGFAGYVGPGTDEDVSTWATPAHTPSELRHLIHHDVWPSSFRDRHERAQDELRATMTKDDVADIEDPRLFHFMNHHYSDQRKFREATADTTAYPIYATQTHLSKEHLGRYRSDPHGTADMTGGIGAHAPVLITHEGRVHAADGHHRLSAAIERGETELPVWHFDLDHFHMPEYDGQDEGEHR